MKRKERKELHFYSFWETSYIANKVIHNQEG